MNYRVRLPRPVRQQVADWGLGKDFELALYRKIRDLLQRSPPDLIGRRVVAPIPCLVVTFPMSCPVMGREMSVTLWVNDKRTWRA